MSNGSTIAQKRDTKVDLDHNRVPNILSYFHSTFAANNSALCCDGFSNLYSSERNCLPEECLKLPLHLLLSLFWVLSGVLAALACVIAKRIFVGRKKPSETVPIWSIKITMDSTWQAIRTLVGDYFMEMTSGSILFVLWMKLMGADIEMDYAAYVDSMGALLNPETVKIEEGV